VSVRNVVQIPRDAGTATSWLISDELLPGRRRAGLVSYLNRRAVIRAPFKKALLCRQGSTVRSLSKTQEPVLVVESGGWSFWKKRWTKDKGQREKVTVSNRTPGSWFRDHSERFRDASSFMVSLIRAVGFWGCSFRRACLIRRDALRVLPSSFSTFSRGFWTACFQNCRAFLGWGRWNGLFSIIGSTCVHVWT